MKLSSWDPDIRSIVTRINGKDVDLQLDFQRQEVWPLAKKKRLIDAILREWSIPPVHFVVTPDNRLEVLDGQHPRPPASLESRQRNRPIYGGVNLENPHCHGWQPCASAFLGYADLFSILPILPPCDRPAFRG